MFADLRAEHYSTLNK